MRFAFIAIPFSTLLLQAVDNVPMTNPKGMLAFHEQGYGHTVTWTRLSDGRILMSGSGRFRISTDRGISWSEEFKGKDPAGEEVDALCLASLSGKSVGSIEMRPTPGAKVRRDTQFLFRRSEDDGKTWSAPVVINHREPYAYALQDVLLRTSSGRLVFPVYASLGPYVQNRPYLGRYPGAPFAGGYLNGIFIRTDAHFHDPRFTASYAYYSDDEGRTWERSRNGELLITLGYGGAFDSTSEPSVTEISPGHLLMFLRTRLGRYYQSRSRDNGDTWSPPEPTQLAGTQAPAQIRTLPHSGHLLAVFTQQGPEEIRRGFIRTRLSSAVSRGRGGIWEFFQNVESIHQETHVEPGPIEIIRPTSVYPMVEGPALENDPRHVTPLPAGYGWWSYPSVLVLDDRVLISYSYGVHDTATGAIQKPNGSRLKVLPLSWFYGGREPSDNPELKKLGLPVKP